MLIAVLAMTLAMADPCSSLPNVQKSLPYGTICGDFDGNGHTDFAHVFSGNPKAHGVVNGNDVVFVRVSLAQDAKWLTNDLPTWCAASAWCELLVNPNATL